MLFILKWSHKVGGLSMLLDNFAMALDGDILSGGSVVILGESYESMGIMGIIFIIWF